MAESPELTVEAPCGCRYTASREHGQTWRPCARHQDLDACRAALRDEMIGRLRTGGGLAAPVQP